MLFYEPQIHIIQTAIDEYRNSKEYNVNTKYILADNVYDIDHITGDSELFKTKYIGHAFVKEPTAKEIRNIGRSVYDKKYSDKSGITDPNNPLYANTREAAINRIIQGWKIIRLNDGYICYPGVPGYVEEGYYWGPDINEDPAMWYELGELVKGCRDITCLRIASNSKKSEIYIDIDEIGKTKIHKCPKCKKYDIYIEYTDSKYTQDDSSSETTIGCAQCGTRFKISKYTRRMDGVVMSIDTWNSLKIGKTKKGNK